MSEIKHSRLSASGSGIWLNCPGSVKLSEQAPPKTSHPSAQEGTVAHSVCETALDFALGKTKTPHSEMLGEDINGVMIDREMINSAQIYVDYIMQIFDPEKDQIHIEKRVTLDKIHPDMFGTADCIIIKENKSVHIVDFKYGRYPVKAKNNSQMIYYALGVIAGLDYTPAFCSLSIVQPRSSDDKKIKDAIISGDDYDFWTEKFKNAAISADIGTPIKKGQWCTFCQAKPICKLHNLNA